MQTLGILGGLGPESTGSFYLSLIREFQRVCKPMSNSDYPHILVNSIPATDLITGEITTEVLGEYKQGLQQLEQWGADSIVVVCNSAYCFYDELEDSVSVPLWSARNEVEARLRENGVERILVLASPTTIRCGLYQYPDVESVELTHDQVTRLGEIITHYNTSGSFDGAEIDRFLRKQTKNTVVLAGCTEMAQMLRTRGATFLDPMQVLVEAIVERWNFENRFPLTTNVSPIHEKGIFSLASIPSQEIFYKIPLTSVSNVPVSKWAHVAGRWFNDETVVNRINHSCAANAKIVMVDGVPALQALLEIKAGEEVTCNYNETETGGEEVPCQCGTSDCLSTFKRIV